MSEARFCLVCLTDTDAPVCARCQSETVERADPLTGDILAELGRVERRRRQKMDWVLASFLGGIPAALAVIFFVIPVVVPIVRESLEYDEDLGMYILIFSTIVPVLVGVVVALYPIRWVRRLLGQRIDPIEF